PTQQELGLHDRWALECARKSVTLVKEETGVLPLSPAKTPRILLYPLQAEQGVIYSAASGVMEQIIALLTQEGFQVSVFTPNPNGLEGLMDSQKAYTDRYDLMLYIANLATKSNQTTVRIEWAQPMGANVPCFLSVIPTVFVSVENPYHLLDVPRVRTYINTYHSSPHVLRALVNKLMGREPFEGKSPVDPFCGMWDTHL
ncbi:MAG: glycoside hydrolase family 3 protein, partial [Candidatus Limiplasma sp.]|nr:glycoside hydrolase family 3 protein [Candidatus Limiplasma sp.]